MKVQDIYYQCLDLERKLENSINSLIKLNKNNNLDEGLKHSMAEEIKYRINELDKFKNKKVEILS